MNIAFPWGFATNGRTTIRDDQTHIRDMIEQLLFTRPGERVNRPDFGSGLMYAVFGAASPEVATALEFNTRAALQRYLGDIIEIQDLDVRADDAALIVDVRYAVRTTAEHRIESFAVGGAP